MPTLPKLARHDWTTERLALKADTADLGGAALLDVGTAAGTVMAGDWKPAAADMTDSTAAGQALLTAEDTSAQRTILDVGAQPGVLAGVTITAEGTNPRPLAVIGQTVYGHVGVELSASVDDGLTWVRVQTLPGAPIKLLGCSDGEVLLVTALVIRKSSGWATDPSTATWTTVVSTYQTAFFARFSVDGDGTKFIASEYGNTRSDSRYVHISTDSGESWTTVWDTSAEFPLSHGESHVHGACYDPWEDRFWFAEGHGAPIGLRYSDDDGATWHLIPHGGAFTNAAPTVLVATNDGIACGTDDHPNGIVGIRRTEAAATLKAEIAFQFWQGTAPGAYGFAQWGCRDPRTGIAYMGWRSEYAAARPVIVAGTASTGAVVWDSGVNGVSHEVAVVVVTADGVVLADYTASGAHSHLRAKVGAPGAQFTNQGNLLGGAAAGGLCVAAGLTAAASGAESTALGHGAAATGTYATALGRGTIAGSSGTAVGRGATASGTSATAVGTGATASGVSSSATGQGALASGTNAQAVGLWSQATATGALAIGKSAVASNGNTVSIGNDSTSSGNISTAIGAASDATNTRSTAIGYGAQSTHAGSVALGAEKATDANSQVMMGAVHIALAEVVSQPPLAAANGARLYVKDDGTGKTQLVVRFQSGGEVVLATEA